MTGPTQSRFRRTDLAHGAEYVLAPSASFRDHTGSLFTAKFGTETALHAFLDMVWQYPGKTSTVTLFLKPRGYRPPSAAPPEFLPSSLYFDVDQASRTAAAALLLIDSAGTSHQWLTRGGLGRDDIVLIMDPHNPEYATFPPESFIPVETLRDAVTQWAFGDELPPPAATWRLATEEEAGWPVGSGYQTGP